nr:MAG TPA: hypothetical protein [Caudoviricetes sp.]DAW81718.1 MAG TPA: hypothetical protein [Caudoviricetes sp.]
MHYFHTFLFSLYLFFLIPYSLSFFFNFPTNHNRPLLN